MNSPPICSCCTISCCPDAGSCGGGCSRSVVVTCDICGQDCSCGGCLVDQGRLGQKPRLREMA